jgi:nitrite reductase/ring-hydroxylating ferredoxin subunit
MSSSKEGFKKVANKRDFEKGNLLKVEPDGKPIVLSMVDGKVYAMDAICTHEGGPLEEVTCKNTVLHVLGIMLYLMYGMERFLIQQFGLQI